MSKTTMITVLALLATATADPLVFSAPLYASPYTSAAYEYLNPAASVVAAPAVPAAVPATVPYASVSAYSYGSSIVQDYSYFPAVVNPSPSLAYSLPPYAYAADFYYKK